MFVPKKMLFLSLSLALVVFLVLPRPGHAQLPGGFSNTGGGFGSPFGGGMGDFGSGFGGMGGPSGNFGIMGQGFGNFGSGLSGGGIGITSIGSSSPLGTRTGFRSLNTGLMNRLPGPLGSSDLFATTRANPIPRGQTGGPQAYGVPGAYGQNMNPFTRFPGMTAGYGTGQGPTPGVGQQVASADRGKLKSLGSGFSVEFSSPPAAQTEILGRLQSMLAKAPALPAGRNITLEMKGSTLVLAGKVATGREKDVIEAMVRLEPGVHEIRNDIQVKVTSAQHSLDQ